MKTSLLIYAPYYLDPSKLTDTTYHFKLDESICREMYYYHPQRRISGTNDFDANLKREAPRPIRHRTDAHYKTRGRKPRYRSAAQFVHDAIKAHLKLVKDSRMMGHWESQHDYSQESIAYEMGYKSVEGWRKRAKALQIDLSQLKEDALLAERDLQESN